MRPISFTSCVGKVVERMVLRRLQAYLEETDEMPAAMYGFRQHLSTQDDLVQLNELVVKRATKNAPRGILAQYLKGAFDNVSPASVLENQRNVEPKALRSRLSPCSTPRPDRCTYAQ
ncbi:uncharacterized protein LOC144168659 [Haemaphysalis longicornis]